MSGPGGPLPFDELLMDGGCVEILREYPVPHVMLRHNKIAFINPAAVALFDGESAEPLLGKEIMEFIHPLDQERALSRMCSLDKNKPRSVPTKIRINTLANRLKMVISSSAMVCIKGERVIVATGVDVTDIYAMDNELRESEESFQRLFENMHDVFYRTNDQQQVVLVGPGAKRLLGYGVNEVIGKPASYFYPRPEDRQAIIDAVKKFGEVKDFPGQLRHKRGHVLDVSISSRAIMGPNGEFLGMEGVFRDVTEEVNIKKELKRLASTDDLTGLLNRRSFLEKANHLVRSLQRYQEDCLVVILDIDCFKEINDTHGHLSGDRILKDISFIVKGLLRESDIYGRLGGDEFSIILRRCPLQEGHEICSRIVREIKDTKISLVHQDTISLSVSLGVTPLVKDDNPFVLALARADRALYLAKTQGRGCFGVTPLDGDPYLPMHTDLADH